MCLLAFAHQHHPRWRFLLAGNRDEFHERPTAALAEWADRPALVAGRDLRSGGTWAGVDAHGRVAVVTNVRDPSIALAAAPSRGGLPVDFLAGGNDADTHARELLERASAYAPFNLILADAGACRFVSNHPRPRQRPVLPGVHALSNGDLDEPWPKTRQLRARMNAWIEAGDEDVTPLWQALADETTASDRDLPSTGVSLEWERMLSPAFIRSRDYGTRTSTLIAIDQQGHGWIAERRFGPDGVFEGETRLEIAPPSR
ncbi:NRDE family protein, partial [Pseudoxanthomonas dokdonensis]